MITTEERSYCRQTLHQSPQFEVATCEWKQNATSQAHAHGWSECYVLIQHGTFENLTHNGIKSEMVIREAGQVIVTPPGADHQIKCVSESGKTLHVYVPRITEELTQTNLTPPSLEKLRSELNLGLESNGSNWQQLISEVENIQKHSLSTHSPLFMNQLFSGVLPEMLLAESMIAKTKSTMATFEASPALTLVEMEVTQQLGHLIGWNQKQTEGITVPGGSAANFMALHCARQKKFPQFKAQGMAAVTPLKIFVSHDAHYSFKKACVVLGFGTDALVTVKTDSRGKMLTDDLADKISACEINNEIPLIVCATAGTTVLGAFDPISEIADLCEQKNIWLHVDAAWGGPVLFSENQKSKVAGIHRADSVTFDAHKLFGASLTCSFFVSRHPQILLEANDVSGAEYLFHDASEVIDRGRLSWQCGRKADAMSFWTIWKSAGTQGLGDFVDRLMQVQSDTVEWLQSQPRLHLFKDPEFLNICVRVQPPIGSDADPKAWSMHVRNELRKKNLTMINYSSTVDGNTFLRLILAHPKINIELTKQILSWALEIE